jgi:hypothetical protein
MKEVFTVPVKHGVFQSLTQKEIDDLVEYMNSL